MEVVTEGRNAFGGEVARTGVLGRLPDSPDGTLQLDMDGSKYESVNLKRKEVCACRWKIKIKRTKYVKSYKKRC